MAGRAAAQSDGGGAAALVIAQLGPTNTGKTHRAIERMLEHGSGMLGLPLRLLAREVYDRVTSRIGEDEVALITGEEKRVPARPRYWICTVEAMPMDRPVDFLAVDEIQLIDHPERGHVFTDRLLNARGRMETWFLGSDSCAALLKDLLDNPRMERRPRMSTLRYAGSSSLGSLPKRSAVVAFSLTQVYELADAIRRRHGGAAVVVGALSPRARNAQVALFESGEVDYMVATDAIGMGLNLNLDHVAMAGLGKFDGQDSRPLHDRELAQIVGRAGRHTRDGSFGTLSSVTPLSSQTVQAMEQHRFAAQTLARYRNSALDFSSVDGLLQSLQRKPGHPSLRMAPVGDDQRVLQQLGTRPEVQARCADPQTVALLWTLCQVPDYEKSMAHHHADMLHPLFLRLADEGNLDPEDLRRRLQQIDQTDGDIHALMSRISSIRTWNYISHQPGWLRGAEQLQQEARAIEDRLSDALHERLRDRFVEDRPARRWTRRGKGQAQGKDAKAANSPFASLLDMNLELAGEPSPESRHDDWVHRLVESEFERFELEPDGRLRFEGERIAQLRPGQRLRYPGVRMRLPEHCSPSDTQRIERRIKAWLEDLPGRLAPRLAPEDSAEAGAALRGIVYQLEQGLGSLSRSAAREQLRELTEEERDALKRADVCLGRHSLFVGASLSPSGLAARQALCQLQGELPARTPAISQGEALLKRAPGIDPNLYLKLGFVALRSHVLRCDLMEQVSEALTAAQDDDARQEAAQLLPVSGGEEREALLRDIQSAGRKRKRRRRRRRGSQPAS